MYGYSGKILHIDLKTKKNWVETKPEEWYKLWIGGQDKFDPWIKFAIELDSASLAHRHYESTKGSILGTYEDYQFLESRQPSNRPAIEIKK